MDIGHFHLDLRGLAEIIMATAALIAAWRGARARRRKKDAENDD